MNNNKEEFNEHICFARKNQSNEYFKQCPHKKKYGNFCGKHKNYLVNKLIPFSVDFNNSNICYTIPVKAPFGAILLAVL